MLDPKAVELFQEILKKTVAGKLAWQPTADTEKFVAPMLGKYTLELFSFTSSDTWGNMTGPPSMLLRDDKGNTLVEMNSSIEDIDHENLRVLFARAKRLALRADEKIDEILEGLKKDGDEFTF